MTRSMFRRFTTACLAAITLIAGGITANAAEPTQGKLELKSVGPLAFGPKGTLFIGDPQAGAIFALETGDVAAQPIKPVNLANLGEKLAALLGVKATDVQVNDLVVNPAANRVYLSVSRGKGPTALPVLFKLTNDGELAEVALDSVTYSKIELPKVVAGNKRQEAITGLKFSGGKLYVAGLSNEEFASTLRSIAYPFDGKLTASGIQIYHGAHGKYETASPVRTFAPVEINGQAHILAAYTCTPLVKIPVDELKEGAKVKGTTVAELGNRNRPLDIVTYAKDGKNFALMANSARGVMKVDLENLDKVEAIVSRVSGTAGLSYATLDSLKGVEQLDRLGTGHAVLLVRTPSTVSIQTIELP